jgi:hypothetical protein
MTALAYSDEFRSKPSGFIDADWCVEAFRAPADQES